MKSIFICLVSIFALAGCSTMGGYHKSEYQYCDETSVHNGCTNSDQTVTATPELQRELAKIGIPEFIVLEAVLKNGKSIIVKSSSTKKVQYTVPFTAKIKSINPTMYFTVKGSDCIVWVEEKIIGGKKVNGYCLF